MKCTSPALCHTAHTRTHMATHTMVVGEGEGCGSSLVKAPHVSSCAHCRATYTKTRTLAHGVHKLCTVPSDELGRGALCAGRALQVVVQRAVPGDVGATGVAWGRRAPLAQGRQACGAVVVDPVQGAARAQGCVRVVARCPNERLMGPVSDRLTCTHPHTHTSTHTPTHTHTPRSTVCACATQARTHSHTEDTHSRHMSRVSRHGVVVLKGPKLSSCASGWQAKC